MTQLETDILQSEVKWAMGRITMNGSDKIPIELFQVLKDDVAQVLHTVCQLIWKTAVATGLEKVSFHSNPKERQCQRMIKLLHNCTHFTCYQSKVQNFPSIASTVCELRTSRCSSRI